MDELENLFNPNADPYFLYMGDPYILTYDGNYYLYGTTSNDGFRVYRSDDLLRWGDPAGKNRGYALRKEDVWGSTWFWAPEIYFLNDKFYMYYTVEEHIAVAVSDDPLGPFTQQTQEVLLPYNAIDPHLFIDPASGIAYLYFVRFNSGNPILQSPGDLVGTGHHSLFKDIHGTDMIVYHAHNSRLFVSPRRLFINRIDFDSGNLKLGNIVAYGLSH